MSESLSGFNPYGNGDETVVPQMDEFLGGGDMDTGVTKQEALEFAEDYGLDVSDPNALRALIHTIDREKSNAAYNAELTERGQETVVTVSRLGRLLGL